MPRRMQVYQADGITVTFDPNLCVHSARCLSGLPAVFDVGCRKWVDASAASPSRAGSACRLPTATSCARRTAWPSAGAEQPAPSRSATGATCASDASRPCSGGAA